MTDNKRVQPHWVCGFCGAKSPFGCPENMNGYKPAPCKSTAMWVDETGYAWEKKPQ
jgi:hypothetical protein